ncbi:MAG: hypothetical protein WD850_02545, partial [Candidatus Spechtbacterales bacterium]
MTVVVSREVSSLLERITPCREDQLPDFPEREEVLAALASRSLVRCLWAAVRVNWAAKHKRKDEDPYQFWRYRAKELLVVTCIELSLARGRKKPRELGDWGWGIDRHG